MNTVKITREFDAPIDKVYEALTNPETAAKWMAPGPLQAQMTEYNVGVGNKYKITMVGDKEPHIAVGEFTEVVPNKKIAMTWNWEGMPANPDSIVSFELAEKNGKTELTLTHVGLPSDDEAKIHTQGWNGCLEKLTTVLS